MAPVGGARPRQGVVSDVGDGVDSSAPRSTSLHERRSGVIPRAHPTREEQSMQQRTRNPALDHLDALIGAWETEATHPSLPDTVIRGRATFEWLAGGLFLIWRAAYDHPDIPDCIAILGCDDAGSSVDARQASGG